MARTPPRYDPGLIEQFAENLVRRASTSVERSIAAGAVAGAAVGAAPLTPLGHAAPIPAMFGVATLLVAGLLGGLVGYRVGGRRSFAYRVRAQAALCQVQTERNIALLAAALAARTAPTAPQPPQSSASQPSPPVPAARVA